MAYYTQERKKEIAGDIKKVLKEFGFKGRLGIRHSSTVVLKITSGILNPFENCNAIRKENAERRGEEYHPAKNYLDVNEYHVENNFSGKVQAFLFKVLEIMNKGNHDRSDIMTDYFDVGWYVNIKFGDWNKDYNLIVGK